MVQDAVKDTNIKSTETERVDVVDVTDLETHITCFWPSRLEETRLAYPMLPDIEPHASTGARFSSPEEMSPAVARAIQHRSTLQAKGEYLGK